MLMLLEANFVVMGMVTVGKADARGEFVGFRYLFDRLEISVT